MIICSILQRPPPPKNLLLLGKEGFIIITGILLSNEFQKIIVEWVLFQLVIVCSILQRKAPKTIAGLSWLLKK